MNRKLLHMDPQVVMLDQLMRIILSIGLDAIVRGAIYSVFAILVARFLFGKENY